MDPRRWAWVIGAAFLLVSSSPAVPAPTRPSVVYILLDTTRADHLGAWGYRRPTTPVLDALAARGVRFERHFANSHATRPSMPQLMTGRYYHPNVLAPFQVDTHPREMSFGRHDGTARLLPNVLRAAGYEAIGVSAHTWVSPDSEFGRAFDRLELLPFAPAEAHGDAEPLVERALALWAKRDPAKPTFLYAHFMDAHIPRRLPDGGPDDPVPGYAWQTRFRRNGEPDFGRRRRAWSRYDAHDFTAADRSHYAAVYDTALRRADRALGRLLAALEADDPGLRHTIVVVTADHGEELGEDERIEHGPSLADAVQHVPLIVSGGGIAPGTCGGVTEHVDVVPTLLAALDLEVPEGMVVDGTSWISGGVAPPACGVDAVFYAWEDYRGVRRGHHLLVEHDDRTIAGRCQGTPLLFHLDGAHRRPVDPATQPRRTARLRRLLEDRLGDRGRRYLAQRYDPPTVPFVIRAGFWTTAPGAPVPCLPIDDDTPSTALASTAWAWTGRGIACLDGDGPAVAVEIPVPPGSYRVEAAANPVDAAPWLFGRSRWRRRSFLSEDATQFVSLGTFDAPAGRLALSLPPDVLARRHLLGLRLTPPGATAPVGPPTGTDSAQRQRLRALGYVQ